MAGKKTKNSKRLYLSRKEHKVAGVCGGIAEYAEVDPTVIRLLFILFALMTAIVGGVFFYLLAWAVMPKQD
ncbi:MAG: PspC domain-containing protein [Candidatus Micrarchaeia archaeon]|jgi:phage shock protein PspC (stress-responsive transcriptional regulator)